MAVTENAKYTSSLGRNEGIMPDAGLQALTFVVGQTSPTAGDQVVLMKLPFPIKIVGVLYQGTTDPGAPLTIDIGYGTYDGTTITEGDADYFLNGGDINAAGTTTAFLGPLGVGHTGDAYCPDEQILYLTNATGTTTWAGVLTLLVLP